jgi:hypothetical protein
MADTKVSALTALASGDIVDADIFYVVDATGPTSKSHLWSSIKAEMKTYMDTLYKPFLSAVNVIVPSGVSADVASETVLTHADDGSVANAYVGMTLYNITDGVSGTVTASTATTITVAAGGMSWANTNVYQLGPGPAQSGCMFYVGTAGTIRHPATAGYTAGYYVNVAGVVIVDMASGSMIFQGVLNSAFATLDAGDCIDSPATKGSYYVIHNKSATEAIGLNYANTWLDGGAT